MLMPTSQFLSCSIPLVPSFSCLTGAGTGLMPTSQFLSCSIPLVPSFSCLTGAGTGSNISDNHIKALQHSRFLLLGYAAASSSSELPVPTPPPATKIPPFKYKTQRRLSPPNAASQQPNDHHPTNDRSHMQPVNLGKSFKHNTTASSRLRVQDLVQTLRLRAPPTTSQRYLTIMNKIETHGGFHSISHFNYLLTTLVTADEFEMALKLISNLSSYGLVPDVRTQSILITCYCSQNDPDAAKNVLDHMMLEMGLHPNVATFTTLINAFCKNGRMHRAFEVFETMDRIGCQPTINTYNCLLKGLCYVGKVEEAYDLFTKIKRSSKKPDIYTYTALMNGFCKVGRSDEALGLLDEALKMGLTPNAVSYNTLFNGYFKEGRPLDGIDLLKRMQEGQCLPDYVSYNTLLHGLLKWGEIRSALGVYKEMVVVGFEVDERLMNALFRGLCRRARKEGHLLNDIYELFRRMRSGGCAICHPAYDMAIEAFCSGNELQNALVCLREMIRTGTSPKPITYRNVVRALFYEGKVAEAVSILDLMHLDKRMSNFFFDILIDEMNRHGMLVSAFNVYGAAIKRGLLPGVSLGIALRKKRRAVISVNGCQ